MKKILYITTVPIDFEKPDGVQKKILSHIKAFSNYYETYLLCRANNTICYKKSSSKCLYIIKNKSTRRELFAAAKDIIKRKKFVAIYIRYPNSDPLFLSFLRCSSKNGCKNIIEIPTYPYNFEGRESIKGKIVSIVDIIFRRFLKKYVNRIITYSSDIEIFGIKTIRTLNGIFFNEIEMKRNISNDEIRLIAVSSMFKVHGYERIIEGLSKYYQNISPKKYVFFDLVGEGDYTPLYKKLVKKYKLEKYVIFHGNLYNDELKDRYSTAHIGVNSLAIHRQGLKNESTLKSKEYVAHGLPIISSSYIDALDKNGNEKYVFRVSPDETSVEINKVVDFYQKLTKEKNEIEVATNIRENGLQTCDMIKTFIPIIKYINNEYS